MNTIELSDRPLAQPQRRRLLQGLLAGGALGLSGCASLGGSNAAAKAQVVVIGGGYGGTTVA